MPLLIAAIGIVLLVSAVRGTTTTLFELVHNDLTGKDNFLIWLGAILGLGLFGYIKPVRPIAAGFLVLVGLGLVLSNKGFFANFASAFQSTVNTPAENITAGQNAPSGTQPSGGASPGTSLSSDVQSLEQGASSLNTSLPNVSADLGDIGNLALSLF